MIELQYEEQYTLITVTEEIAQEKLLLTIIDSVKTNMEEGNCNFIVQLETLKAVPSSWAEKLSELAKEVLNNKGILVVAEAPEKFENELNEEEVVTTPTIEEAIDYVFMEEIEKNFFNDEEE